MMGWETRRNGSYYYEKQRRGGRVVSSYVGAGLLGELAACYADRDAFQRFDAQVARQRDRDATRQRERAANALVRDCVALARLALLATGYHDHNGTWRKRKRKPMAKKQTTT